MTHHAHGYNPDGVMAYFISFRCYGTWLHGDPRGSMDRADHHGYGLPPIMADVRREARDRSLLRHPPVLLTPEMRRLTDSIILAVCQHRGWALEALNVRTNHVHAVVRAPSIKPEPVMGAFKSWTTRHLREAGLIAPGITLWSRHGSTIWLWTDKQLANAIVYTLHGQGQHPAEYREGEDTQSNPMRQASREGGLEEG